MLSVRDIADMSGCTPSVILQEINSGRLHAHFMRTYGGWYIETDDYREWLKMLPPDFELWGI